MHRLQRALPYLLSVSLLLLVLPAPAHASESSTSLLSGWGLLFVGGIIDVLVVVFAIWIRESMQRDQRARDSEQRAVTEQLAELQRRQDKLDEKLAGTRETYATKEELQRLEGAIHRQLVDTRQQLEQHFEKYFGERINRLESQVVEVSTDMKKVVGLLTGGRSVG